ncbi:hypothetical protein CCP3SC1AL1_530003 [Gammaproteobacteria bacterium]
MLGLRFLLSVVLSHENLLSMSSASPSVSEYYNPFTTVSAILKFLLPFPGKKTGWG